MNFEEIEYVVDRGDQGMGVLCCGSEKKDLVWRILSDNRKSEFNQILLYGFGLSGAGGVPQYPKSVTPKYSLRNDVLKNPGVRFGHIQYSSPVWSLLKTFW